MHLRMVAREGASELGEVTPREEVPEGVKESTETMASALTVLGSSLLGKALRKWSVGSRKKDGRVLRSLHLFFLA